MKKSKLSLQQETDTDGCNKSYSIKNTEVKVTREGLAARVQASKSLEQRLVDGNSEKLDRLETDLGGKSDL